MKTHDVSFFYKLGIGLMLGYRAWYAPEKLGTKSVAYICAGALVYNSLAFESSEAAMRAVMGLMSAALILLTVALRHQRVSATLFCRAGFAGSFAFVPWAFALELAPSSLALDIFTLLYGLWVLFQAIFMDDNPGIEQHADSHSAPNRTGRQADTISRAGSDPMSPTPVTTGPILGEFKGRPIHAWVAIADGRVFHFSRIAPNPCALQDNEIVLQPGLIYAQRIGESHH